MSAPHLSTFDLKKVLLLVSGSALMAWIVAVGYVQWAVADRSEQIVARLETEERLERLHYEIQRLQELNLYTADQNLKVAEILHEVVESGQGEQKLFLSLIAPEALRAQISHGIPASATIAMSIYESSYGRSQLAGLANNFFGIKAFASAWDGPTVYTTTRDNGRKTKAYFRRYPDIEAAVLGYASFLKSSDRYKKAFAYRDGSRFVQAVLKAGYCPDGDYLRNIQTIMERHKLARLDLPDKKSIVESAGKPALEKKVAHYGARPPWGKMAVSSSN